MCVHVSWTQPIKAQETRNVTLMKLFAKRKEKTDLKLNVSVEDFLRVLLTVQGCDKYRS